MNQVNLIALYTLTKREIVRFFRIWSQTLLPSPISMMLYFFIFGQLIGARIGFVQGYAYIDYIAPGLIMMAVIQNAFSNVVSSFFGTKFQKNIEEMFVAPMATWTILLGFILGGLIRGCLVGFIVTCVALFFTHLKVAHPVITMLVIVSTALLFSLAGFLNGMYSKKFDDITIIPTFILTPLTYLGGVFYSVDMLSPFWQTCAHFNPILYMVNAFRYGVLGIADVPVVFALSFIMLCNIVLFLVTLYLLKKGVGLKA